MISRAAYYLRTDAMIKLRNAGYTVTENAGRLIVSFENVFETVKIPISGGAVDVQPVDKLIRDMNKWKSSQ